eukprot:m.249199 g.249199  ORF g.249199 m.249199 type:complete len:309 (+) comp17510_c0_seq1:16-942(+)
MWAYSYRRQHYVLIFLLIVPQYHCWDCSPIDPQLVLYNRLAKSGSSTLKYLSFAASEQQATPFRPVRDTKFFDRGMFEPEKQLRTAQEIAAMVPNGPVNKAMYAPHLRWLNFTKFDLKQPAYINIFREPVSRLVSSYYYTRYGDVPNKESVRKALGRQFLWTLNHCLDVGRECYARTWMKQYMNEAVSFFCGHAPECGDPSSDAALARAKLIAEYEYIIVGLTAQYKDTVWMLSKLIPSYFGNLTTIYNHRPRNSNVNKNKPKIEPLTPEQTATLRSFGRDPELFAFLNELFDQRLAICRARYGYDDE